MTETRFRPVRAGIINLWDYYDEEFAFADGRLRCAATTARARPRPSRFCSRSFSTQPGRPPPRPVQRREPHHEGEPALSRPGFRARLRVDGVRVPGRDRHPGHRPVGAQEHGPSPPIVLYHRSRMGIEFGLLSADSRPLTAKQLTAILGRDAHYGDKKGRTRTPWTRACSGLTRNGMPSCSIC